MGGTGEYYFYHPRQVDELRKKIGENGKKKYMKYFNSNIVAQYIIDKTLGLKSKNVYLWDK